MIGKEKLYTFQPGSVYSCFLYHISDRSRFYTAKYILIFFFPRVEKFVLILMRITR